MSFIETPGEAVGPAAHMLSRQVNALGYEPNYARPFVHNPQVMDHWVALLEGIKSQMDRRLFELINLSAALSLGSSYCALAFGQRLLKRFTVEQVRLLACGAYGGVVTNAEAAAMRYAAVVARDASAVASDDVQILLDSGLTSADIFNVAAAASARAFFSKLVEGVGARPDRQFMAMDASLRDALVCGRPISAT